MSVRFRAVLMALMSLALFFGFLHLFVESPYNFDRLHVFLFNLCSGGTIILYYTEDQSAPSARVIGFGLISLIYAVLAFLELYIPAMVLSVVLAAIVEMVRIRRFTLFPHNFFQDVPVDRKFHQAALLCLSLGLLISSMVILNNEYLHVLDLPKLKLDTFFLGFSFPLSLITMSVMFSLMKDDGQLITDILKNAGFWMVNMGVIIFFLFILFERLGWQLVVTSLLFVAVVMILWLFRSLGVQVQQKNFLLSGMAFLLCTAITGIAYIILEFFPAYYTPETRHILMKLHSFASLYGWNLSGLAVICRIQDFPIRLHSLWIIFFHWLIVLLFAPLGVYLKPFAVISILAYPVFLYVIFSSQGRARALS